MGQADPADNVEVLIIGAGFSGLCMAAQLRRAGETSFLVLEKADEIGGTWRDNRYPGCACDVASHLYSLSFAPRSDWTRMYPTQPELLAYQQGIVADEGLAPHIRLNTAMRRADWDAAASCWRVTATDGRIFTGRSLVLGTGLLHVPARPAIPGLESFQGQVFHSAEWPADADLKGKRIAVIGTGASAIQFVPEIAPDAARLHVFQRHAPYLLPKPDFAFPPWARAALRWVPGLRRLLRAAIYWFNETQAMGFLGDEKRAQFAETMAKRYLHKQVKDPALRAKLTPDYRFGCKRVLISNNYYPALLRPNVELVTDPIRAVTADAVVTADGAARPVDAIILGTGFDVAGSAYGIPVHGVGGQSLAEAWAGGVKTYYGIGTAGFPNFHMLLGPNTGLGHTSVLIMIEAQVAHVLRCLKRLKRERRAALDVTPAAQAAFDAELHGRLDKLVWQKGGCRSWYQDAEGRNVAIWPDYAYRYVRRVKAIPADAYAVK